MNQLKIYSASAGSGKTFNLVCEYIEKLLENPYIFRNILAVTFTNKSTNEMKTRILSILWGLSSNQSYADSYLKKLTDRTSRSETEIRSKAKDILRIILHDYSNFSIETIDSFLQKVLKNLAKEVRVGSSFDLLLDEKEYIEKAIKEVNNCEELKPYIEKLIEKRLEEGKNWKYDDVLFQLAKEVKRPIVRNNINKQTTNIEEIEAYVEKQKNIHKQFIEELEKKVRDFEAQYNVNDFFTQTYAKEGIKAEKPPFRKKYRKLNPQLFGELEEFFEAGKAKALRASIEISSIYECILLPAINRFKSEALKEDNLFVLKETEGLLAEMIKGNDVSFVYEKIGSRIKHIMIDEFQDTSDLSWINFKFIANECISNQGSGTIFGDLKQSIYRWKEGNWEIMSGLLEESQEDERKSLTKNYRTDYNIVEFNNKLFFDKVYKESLFKNDVKQEKEKEEDKGLLRFNFVEADILEKTVDEINYYINKGFKSSDIALLLRSNSQIAVVAEYLRNKGFNPISDSAFTFNSSRSIKIIIHSLRLIGNKNAFSEYILKEIYDCTQDVINQLKTLNEDISLIDLVDKIINLCTINREDVFISAFYEKLIEFCQQKTQKINEFIKYWNNELKNSEILLDDNEGKDNDSKKIRLLTVHKSKGLEFPIVILPFFNWKYVNYTNTIWELNSDENSPVKLFKSTIGDLKKSGNEIYATDAKIEEQAQKIDTHNLMYVAFTRPKHSLSIISNIKTKKPNSGSDLLDFLDTDYANNKQGDCFIIGNEDLKQEEKEKKEEKDIFKHIGERINIDSFDLEQPNNIKFSLSKEAQNYFDKEDSDSSEDKKNRGINLHNIVAKIYEEKDIEKVEDEEAKEIIKQMFVEAKQYKWFDGTYKVFNEKEIVSAGKTKRFDRIMFGEDEVIIVDYKFSEDTDYEDKYIKQLNEYKKIVSQLGYKNIKTYLWFVGKQIKEVE